MEASVSHGNGEASSPDEEVNIWEEISSRIRVLFGSRKVDSSQPAHSRTHTKTKSSAFQNQK